MSDHFASRAGLIASLPADDPERTSAEKHAETCAACRRSLTEGAELMRLLESARQLDELPEERLESTAIAIERELRDDARKKAFWPSALVVAAFVLELSMARHLRSDALSVGQALAIALIAVAASAWNRSGIRAVVVILSTSAAFAVAMGAESLLATKIGVKCTCLELVAALLPWIAYRRVAAGSSAKAEGAAVAAAGALAGHAALHLSCPVPHADAHLLVFHFGGVVLAAALGALATPGVPKELRGG